MLDLPDYLRPLEHFRAGFPHDAVNGVLARGAAAVPDLVAALDWIASHSAEVPDEVIFHEFALRLLAHLRAAEGLAPALQLARSPEIERLLGDTLTETFSSILAALAGPRWRELSVLIEDPAANEWSRAAGVSALGGLFRAGELPREALTQYVGELFRERLQRVASFVWDSLVALCTDLELTEHLKAIQAAYAEGLADPTVERLQDVERRLSSPSEHRNGDFTSYRLYSEAARDMADWPGFLPEEPDEMPAPVAPDFDSPTQTVVRAGPKVGRNDPCPCGSGRKFKKCCGG